MKSFFAENLAERKAQIDSRTFLSTNRYRTWSRRFLTQYFEENKLKFLKSSVLWLYIFSRFLRLLRNKKKLKKKHIYLFIFVFFSKYIEKCTHRQISIHSCYYLRYIIVNIQNANIKNYQARVWFGKSIYKIIVIKTEFSKKESFECKFFEWKIINNNDIRKLLPILHNEFIPFWKKNLSKIRINLKHDGMKLK